MLSVSLVWADVLVVVERLRLSAKASAASSSRTTIEFSRIVTVGPAASALVWILNVIDDGEAPDVKKYSPPHDLLSIGVEVSLASQVWRTRWVLELFSKSLTWVSTLVELFLLMHDQNTT
ncbi:MAG: hypothetical protein ABS35_15350 [Kaistia sp. SCN 65-12]|nr:MAG: hypothetical protein ABS35_15350 [Kaistia sp. SCN 65-12]